MLQRVLTLLQLGILGALIEAWETSPRAVLLCSRRIGKSDFCCAYLDAVCRSVRDATCVYAAATQTGLRNFSGPIMDSVLARRGGPRPVWKASEGIWYYPETNSRILLIGCDDRHKVDRARGLDALVVVVDEAAVIPGLAYVVESVFGPMIAVKRGRMLLASSAPMTSEHDFAAYIGEASAAGTLVKRTIYDALAPYGLITQQIIDEQMVLAGGPNSTTWRREYMCEIVTDSTSAVLPEMPGIEDPAADDVVREISLLPEHALKYTSIDGGHVDMCVAALGRVLWREQILYIEDEVALSHATSREIAQAVRDQESVRWGAETFDEQGQLVRLQHRRQADSPPQTLADMRDSGLYCAGLAKDDRSASVTRLREMLGARRLVIHPRCKVIIAHMRSAVWAPNGKDFQRISVGGRSHHFDGLDAVRYMVDNADFKTDPRPRVQTLGELVGFTAPPTTGLARLMQGPRRRA